jgi:hypothetical protein
MTEQGPTMDRLHSVLRALRTETKTAKDHARVFREFLDHLDVVRRKPAAKRPHPRPQLRKRAGKRAK